MLALVLGLAQREIGRDARIVRPLSLPPSRRCYFFFFPGGRFGLCVSAEPAAVLAALLALGLRSTFEAAVAARLLVTSLLLLLRLAISVPSNPSEKLAERGFSSEDEPCQDTQEHGEQHRAR